MKAFWDERYQKVEYAYGKTPNEFLAVNLGNTDTKILLPAEGEGRNAVFAAKNGCDVTAFDTSSEGREKALKLAEAEQVQIDYQIESFESFTAQTNEFDAIALIYAHIPHEIRTAAYRHLLKFLKPGGRVIFEAFSKNQLGLSSGGPKNEAMLFSETEVKAIFSDLTVNYLAEEEVNLNEGPFHQGTAKVIRFIGTK
ncbi:MAG: methyltransferase domain-containing protein [Crocinitomix sp.]|nr:methyltransferase domain-containing protein [Crocinitomix sp.]